MNGGKTIEIYSKQVCSLNQIQIQYDMKKVQQTTKTFENQVIKNQWVQNIMSILSPIET